MSKNLKIAVNTHPKLARFCSPINLTYLHIFLTKNVCMYGYEWSFFLENGAVKSG